MLPAAWPQNTDTAKWGCGLAAAEPGPPQPPIPNTTSPRLQNIYLRQQRPLLPSSSTTQSSVPDCGGRRLGGLAAWSRAWQCLRLLKITAVWSWICPVLPRPLEVKPSIRPSPRLILHPPRSRKLPRRRFGPRAVSRLRLRGVTGGGRLGCSLAGTELCIAPSVQLWGGARRVHVSARAMEELEEHEHRAPLTLQFGGWWTGPFDGPSVRPHICSRWLIPSCCRVFRLTADYQCINT